MEIDEKDYPHLTEEILFNRYAGGDLRAFDEILKRTKGLVYSLILRYVRNNEVADEIFQDVFLKICKNKELFRESVSFKSWMVTITKNTCIDHIRKQTRSLKTDPLDGDSTNEDRRSLAETVAADEPSPHTVLMENIERADLKELLDELPEEQRETFYQKIIMEMTFEEIGQAMGVSTNTAKSRYRYAITTLRGLVKRKQFMQKAVG